MANLAEILRVPSTEERAARSGGVSSIVTTARARYLEEHIHTIFQVSTSGALVAGVDDREVSVKTRLEHGVLGVKRLTGAHFRAQFQQYPQFVETAPALDDLAVLEPRNLHSAGSDRPTGGRDPSELAAMTTTALAHVDPLRCTLMATLINAASPYCATARGLQPHREAIGPVGPPRALVVVCKLSSTSREAWAGTAHPARHFWRRSGAEC